MKEKIPQIMNNFFIIGFCLLCFFTPLLMTTVNYELFEFNKMIFVYFLTVVLSFGWFTKMVLLRKINFVKNVFSLPLILFLISQIISTIFTLDRYTSLWGYYSRFHGGLVPTICYLLLFFIFINNFPRNKLHFLFAAILSSGFLISLYGIAQHFGIDKNLWVQDVQNRVFSTLGQPNWLAAYLNIIIFLSLGLGLSIILLDNYSSNNNLEFKNKIIFFLTFFLLPLIFYLTLLFTKSRSGFIAFWPVFLLFGIYITSQYFSKVWRHFVVLLFLLLSLTSFMETPFASINKYTLAGFLVKPQQVTPSQPAESAMASLDTGITESGEIRKIVWQGAWEIFKRNPLIGTGVESFAYAYYLYRPLEHNLTSEWDFLYNKAHNEYLNYLATTGILGFGTYLLFIFTFLIWITKKIIFSKNNPFLLCSLLASFLTILITNFFGFSVVTVALYFFLLPAIGFLLSTNGENQSRYFFPQNKNILSKNQQGFLIIISVISLFLILFIGKIWWADYFFAKGENASKMSQTVEAVSYFQVAVSLNKFVPLYHSELSYAAAQLAALYAKAKDNKKAQEYLKQALLENEETLRLSPNNVNFYKTATKMYFELISLDEKYTLNAINSLEKAKTLAPTDPKIDYNLGILYGRIGKNDLAIKNFQQAAFLKPNYKDAYYALALFFEEQGQIEKAIRHLKEILTKIDPNDTEVRKKLEQLEKK